MTPTLLGRLQTRIFLAVTAGLGWTVLAVPWLPLPAGVPDHTAYRIALQALGLMTAAGLAWELIYHALQQGRWDKDWPSLFMLLTVVNEAVPLWLLLHAVHVIHGTDWWTSPALPFYATYVATTWGAIWLFAQGPIRVLHVRWRFEGGQVLLFEHPMARRARRCVASMRSMPSRMRRCAVRCFVRRPAGASSCPVPAVPAAPLPMSPHLPHHDPSSAMPVDMTSASLVEGVLCGRGHFCHPEMRYCGTCGDRIPGYAPRVKGPRPPLGVLIGADGTIQAVDEDVEVMDGRASVRIAGWTVTVSGTGEGVRIEFPGGCVLPAGPGTQIPLVSGAEVCAGEERIRFEPLCPLTL